MRKLDGYSEALDTAASLDAFDPANIESEYTRGIVELIAYTFTDPYSNDDGEPDDIGSDAYRQQIIEEGQQRARETGYANHW